VIHQLQQAEIKLNYILASDLTAVATYM